MLIDSCWNQGCQQVSEDAEDSISLEEMFKVKQNIEF